MSAHSASTVREVEYRPQQVVVYGKQKQYTDTVLPAIWVRLTGDSELSLSIGIDEARALFYGLGVALVEHAVAQCDPRGAWAVA
ncbi:hypothetical protein [Nocardia sp. CA-145437]|uniref:hypothetical protein n=1 Tax=unclassified Nocardia TaxID=2637762 RepID=UPI003D964422